MPIRNSFARFADRSARLAGSFWAFSAAALVILAWVVTGPVFGFSTTWQLAINTGTTIVTFLMVFLIQHAANKDTRALQLKLDEVLASLEGASNLLIDAEELSDVELDRLSARFRDLARRARTLRPGAKTSIDEDQSDGGR